VRAVNGAVGRLERNKHRAEHYWLRPLIFLDMRADCLPASASRYNVTLDVIAGIQTLLTHTDGGERQRRSITQWHRRKKG
jgi:hypothetical protein